MKVQMFTDEEFLMWFRKGLRNGNWRNLSRLEKALYWTSLEYTRIHGKIVNEVLLRKLFPLVDKLKATSGARVFKRGYDKRGYEKAVELLNKGEYIFAWAPRLREWLKDPDYIFWLGTECLRIAT